MIKKIITKEKFSEEFEHYISKDVEPIDALVTIARKYELTEDQIPKLMTEQILHIVRKDAERLNYLKEKSEETQTLDDFF